MNPNKARDLFVYDFCSGRLKWLKPKARRNKKGNFAGSKGQAARTVMVDYINYKEHIIIWMLIYNEIPTLEIDHKDNNPFNNKLDNLRLATRKQNAANIRMHRDNSLGYKGVSKSRNKYVARICGERIGLFDTPEEAAEAYKVRAKALFDEFSNI